MAPADSQQRPPSHRARALLANLALAAGATIAVLLAIELAFRLAPGLLPAGSYGFGRPDPDLGTNVHGGRAIYNKTRLVVRDPNRDGFMDVDHSREGAPGALRIGFFGDSYVESLQVPIDDVFFRRLPERLAATRAVETLGFGMSGWGTLHAKRAHDVFAPRYDLDVAVYVFVENDLGDQMYEISAGRESAGSTKPFLEAIDEPPGYRVRTVTSSTEPPFWFGAAKQVQRHSLLAQAFRARVQLLRQAGVRMQADARDVEMSSVAGAVPDANDVPATWPARHAADAKRLGEIVLREWRDAAAGGGRLLAVLYVPRGHEQLDGRLANTSTWRPWLGETCAALGIPLIDPSEALARRLAAGEPVYTDHFSPAGHDVVAGELAAWFASRRFPAQPSL